MKKAASILILFMLILPSPPANAQSNAEEEFASQRLWHLAEMPVWFFLWNTVHESSHALTAIALGYTGCGIHPYPHEHNGVFAYGDSFCDSRSANKNGKFDEPIFYLMPSLVDITVFTVSDLLLARRVIDPDSLAGGLLFFGGMLAPWLDFTLNANNRDGEYADNAIFAELVGIPRWSVMAFQDILAAAGLIRLISMFQEVFFEERETDNLSVTILPSPNNLGLQVAGQF